MTTVRKVEFKPAVNDSLIGMLEEALAEAKAGTLAAGSFVGAQSDDAPYTFRAGSSNVWRDLAALRWLEHRIMRDIDD